MDSLIGYALGLLLGLCFICALLYSMGRWGSLFDYLGNGFDYMIELGQRHAEAARERVRLRNDRTKTPRMRPTVILRISRHHVQLGR